MKILKLDSLYRSWLTERGALGLGTDLNEKFKGLTHEESVFYAEVTSEPFGNWEDWDEEEIHRFLELHEHHQLVLDFQMAARRFKTR